MSLISNSVTIENIRSVDDAPHYTEETKLLKIMNCLIVSNGTECGNPTVDLQLIDAEGNKYVIMATAGIFEMMGTAVKARRETDEAVRRKNKSN